MRMTSIADSSMRQASDTRNAGRSLGHPVPSVPTSIHEEGLSDGRGSPFYQRQSREGWIIQRNRFPPSRAATYTPTHIPFTKSPSNIVETHRPIRFEHELMWVEGVAVRKARSRQDRRICQV